MGGKRYSYDDEEFKNLLNAIQKKFRSGNVTGGLTRAVPIFKKLLSNLKFFKEEEESDALVEKFIQVNFILFLLTKFKTCRKFSF